MFIHLLQNLHEELMFPQQFGQKNERSMQLFVFYTSLRGNKMKIKARITLS